MSLRRRFLAHTNPFLLLPPSGCYDLRFTACNRSPPGPPFVSEKDGIFGRQQVGNGFRLPGTEHACLVYIYGTTRACDTYSVCLPVPSRPVPSLKPLITSVLYCSIFFFVFFQDKSTGVSSRRHYHATCEHRHKGGPKGGMIFHHHQLEKIQKHQRAHIRTLHKKTPGMLYHERDRVLGYVCMLIYFLFL